MLCDLCSARMSTPNEVEFVFFLTGLMEQTPEYTDIHRDAILGQERRYRADILATRLQQSKKRRLLIECKSSRFAGMNRVNDVIQQLKRYADLYGDCQKVLAIPASLSESETTAIREAGIELWDLDFLATKFRKQVVAAPTGYFKALLQSKASRGSQVTRESMLLGKLQECEPGKRDWSLYQKLVGEIVEHLFCGPLATPMSEHADLTRTNRRDFIVPNYAVDGFWSFLRNRYMADYLVVDAKNYTRKVAKAEVLQIANYLKPHGAGLVGFIFSRNGGDLAGCAQTLREQWAIHQKMIIVFTDEDVESMLRAKEDNSPPEVLVEKKIELFRLSM